MNQMLTVPEVAEKLRLSKSTVYHLVCARRIPFFKIGQKILFDEADLTQWVAARRVGLIASEANSDVVGNE